MSLLELFCDVDAFCIRFQPALQTRLLPDATPRREHKRSLCQSEVMTIRIY